METVFLTATEADYIREKKDSRTVADIAKDLKRGAATIYAYYKQQGLTPYRSPEGMKRPYTHPFREKNRRLEKIKVKEA